jgi:amino-acid N-acetyltransferase
VIYRFADENDLEGIRQLLETCDLPTNDLRDHLTNFIVAREKDRVIGCVGFEMKGPLLRSLAVAPDFRGHGIAKKLCVRLLEHAKELAATEIFLLTTTASDFFEKIGFIRKSRNDAPHGIRTHKQFAELCPDSAVLMWIDLGRGLESAAQNAD